MSGTNSKPILSSEKFYSLHGWLYKVNSNPHCKASPLRIQVSTSAKWEYCTTNALISLSIPLFYESMYKNNYNSSILRCTLEKLRQFREREEMTSGWEDDPSDVGFKRLLNKGNAGSQILMENTCI